MRRSMKISAVVAMAAASALGRWAPAGTSTWTGGGATVAGAYNNGLVAQQNVNYYPWDTTTAANWGGTAYTVNDDAVFNVASGTFVIQSTSNALNPNSMTFTGGATYDFTRASTASSTSDYAGWVSSGYSPNIAGPDSFSSGPIWGGTSGSPSSVPGFNLTLGTAGLNDYTGTVILRTRPQPISGYTGTTTINSGTLEIHDAGALPAAVANNPSLTLNGGTFAVNINTGSWTYQQGNNNPSSTQLGGLITVNDNSALSNAAVDGYGRARTETVWQGGIAVAANKTLTINTGGGVTLGANVSGAALSGSGTIKIGADAANSAGNNRLRLNGNLATGSAALNFDLGTNGILEDSAAVNGTSNLGSLTGGSGTILRGSTTAATASGGASTLSVGGNGGSTSFAGTITNGDSASNAGSTGASSFGFTGANVPTIAVPVAGMAVLNANLTKVGAGSLALTGSNLYGGTTTVSAGTLSAQSSHALGDGPGAVTVATNATLDLSGNSPTAGKQFVLSGGSLVNNGGSAVTLGSGASGSFLSSATGGSGAWAGPGNTATVSFSAPGGAGTTATGQVVLQLGWIRFDSGGSPGSGYTTEPKITFSAPDLPNGRPIKAVATLNASNQVAGITILDPGYGYTSVPTVTVDNTGTNGSGFTPVFTMTAAGVQVTNTGSGYTAAPTVTFGGAGYAAGSATGVGGFGQISLTATSNVGGSNGLSIGSLISGAGGLTKIGSGVTTLTGANTYAGNTAVNAGTLLVSNTVGSGTGAGNVTVGDPANLGTTATLGGNGSISGSVTVNANGIVSPGASIGTLAVGSATLGTGTLKIEYDGTGAGSIDLLNDAGALDVTGGTVNFAAVGAPADDPAYVFAKYGSLTGTFASVLNLPGGYTIDYAYNDGVSTNNIALVSSAVPEPASLAVIGLSLGRLLVRRRRRRA